MSLLNQILSGSLLSRERLLQARDFYAPAPPPDTAAAAFARWTERVATQTQLASARQLAVCPTTSSICWKPNLSAAPSASAPAAPAMPLRWAPCWWQPPWWASSRKPPSAAGLRFRSSGALSLVCLVLGLPMLAWGLYGGFGSMHLDLGHGTTGLYVGKLDDIHPWVFEAAQLTLNASAEDYRQRVLRERGALRGMDCVLMKQIVHAQQLMDETRAARALAEALQSPAAAEPIRPAGPNLVRIATRSATRQRLGGQPVQWTH
jgi:hypothetical protein